MARVSVKRIVSHPENYVRLYSSQKIGNNMFLRGLRVETRAKVELSTNPPRVDTGRLRASIATHRIRHGIIPAARVGTNVFYWKYVYYGTGLYGPYHHPITPRQATRLRFRPKGSTKYVYALSVKGMQPNRFLTNALPAAKLG